MPPFSTIYIQYKKALDVFSSMEEKIVHDIRESSRPYTGNVLYYNVKKLCILLESIEKITGSFYCSQVLMRVIVEHFIVGYYIWTKSEDNINDEIGEEYSMQYFISEFFKRENYKIGVDNIKSGAKDRLTLDVIRSKYEGMSDIENSEIESVHRAANQFDIRKIGDYLINKSKLNSHFADVNVMMLDYLDMYNFLSSYIHGGPFSERQTFFNEYNNGKEQHQIEYDNLQHARIAVKQSITNVFFLLSKDYPDDYKKPLEDVLFIE